MALRYGDKIMNGETINKEGDKDNFEQFCEGSTYVHALASDWDGETLAREKGRVVGTEARKVGGLDPILSHGMDGQVALSYNRSTF